MHTDADTHTYSNTHAHIYMRTYTVVAVTIYGKIVTKLVTNTVHPVEKTNE